MLGALLESMSFAISQLYADRYDFLRTRAWYGNSHIGNRPIQARAYYDLARSVQPGTICEVGFNGGHSAAVFLSAAGRRAKMVSFDLAEFESVHKSNCRGASPRHRRDACSMAWWCRFLTTRRSQHGRIDHKHPTHWLISTQPSTLNKSQARPCLLEKRGTVVSERPAIKRSWSG